MAKQVLGRGLSALLSGNSSSKQSVNVNESKAKALSPAVAAPVAAPVSAAAPASVPAAVPLDKDAEKKRVLTVAVERIRPCPFQPRKDFSQESLQELADSIKGQGIVQPLIVRKCGEDFELIAGERRWRASQIVGLKEVPVLIREADDRTVLELALIENLQRENLNPIEEALGFSQLMEQFQLTQEEASAKVGKSRAVVANSLRLLKLAPDIQTYVRNGRLSVGHAKVILGLPKWEEQKLAADRILKKSLNVRQTEELVAYMQNIPSEEARTPVVPSAPNAHITDLERKLQERLGTKVHLNYRKGKGTVEIKFFSDDDLERILQLTGIELD